MEKIIYNTKLNKILACFLIVIILFGYISPLRVNAENTNSCSLSDYIKMICEESDLEDALDTINKKKNKDKRSSISEAIKKYDDRYKNMDLDKISEMFFWSDGIGEFYHFYGEGTTITYNDSYEITDVSIDGEKVIIDDLYFWLWYLDKYNDAGRTYSNCKAFKDRVYAMHEKNYINTGVTDSGEIYIEIYVINTNSLSDELGEFLGIGDSAGTEAFVQYYGGNSEDRLTIKLLSDDVLDEERDEKLEGATTQEERELIILEDFLKRYDYDGNPDTQDRLSLDTIKGMIELYKSGSDKIIVTWNEDRTKILSVEFDELHFGDELVGFNPKEEAKKGKDGGDIGGILLSPVFYLINFVVDAIAGSAEDMMTGEGLATGIDVLQVKKTPPKEGKTYQEIKINMDEVNVLGDVQYPNIKYTPEEIFSGQIDLLSIDFISGQTPERDEDGNIKYDEDGNVKYSENSDSGWVSVRKVISSWYKVIRMISIIGLLSVLIYTGIKIIISANAKDKAKYKEWIINWFIAVAILFSMHYIMSFIISVTREINNLLNNACQGIKIVNGTKESVTNLMGLVRFMIQSEDFSTKIGYEVMYIALIVYTVKFTIIYLKRVLNMAFLTLIAPIVALTYPIDKLNDGKAQGFDMWLKEYIFNALLQPMHYVMYYILLGSAVSIAVENPLYAIVVLMFMTEAEKLLKKIFGFDKAGGGTVGGMAGAFAAGAIASNIKNIARMAKLPGGNGGKSGSDGKVEDYLKDPKPTDTDDNENLWLNGNSGGNNNVGGNNNEDDDNREIDEDAIMDNTTLAEGDWDHDGSSDKNFRKPGESEEDESQVPVQPISSDEDEDDDEIDEDAILANTTLADDVEEQQTPPLPPPPPSSPKGQNDNNTKLNNDGTSASASDDSSQEQTSDDKWKRRMNGWKNVGKTLIKPAWDLDKPLKYRMKKVGKAALRGGVGAALGIGAAAVQAGISITDGKYNPMEGVATFSAGYAGGGQISRGVGSLIDTYREGRDEGNKEAIMKRATEKWGQREDVIAYNKKKYDEKDRQRVLEIQKKLLEQGITDTGEMHKCIKYIKSINNGKIEGYTDDMIRKSRVLHDFRKEMTDQGVNIYDEKKRTEYINSVAKTDKEKQKILRAKFKAAVDYDEAQK